MFSRIFSEIAGAESVPSCRGINLSLRLLPQERKDNHAQMEITSLVLELVMK